MGQLEDGGGGGSFGEGGGSAASRHHGGIVEHRQNYRLSGLPEGVDYEVIIFHNLVWILRYSTNFWVNQVHILYFLAYVC